MIKNIRLYKLALGSEKPPMTTAYSKAVVTGGFEVNRGRWIVLLIDGNSSGLRQITVKRERRINSSYKIAGYRTATKFS